MAASEEAEEAIHKSRDRLYEKIDDAVMRSLKPQRHEHPYLDLDDLRREIDAITKDVYPLPQAVPVTQNAIVLAERLIQAAVDYESGRCSKREMVEARAAVEAAIRPQAAQVPAHRVVQREVIDWANSLNGRSPFGDDLSRLITLLASAVESDRMHGVAPDWVKMLADNWRGRNGNTTTGDSVRNSCADELEKVAARNQPPALAKEALKRILAATDNVTASAVCWIRLDEVRKIAAEAIASHIPDAAQSVGMREALEEARAYIDRVPYGLELHHQRKAAMEKIEAALAAHPPAAPVETAFLCPRCGTRGTTDGKSSKTKIEIGPFPGEDDVGNVGVSQCSAANVALTDLADALVGIQEDMPSADVRDALGMAAHYLRKFALITDPPQQSPSNAEALRLLAAEDERQSKLHELLETIREQIRLEVAPEHRPEGLFKNIQDAVYAMRGRTRLMDDAAITHVLNEPQGAEVRATEDDLTRLMDEAWPDGHRAMARHILESYPLSRPKLGGDHD